MKNQEKIRVPGKNLFFLTLVFTAGIFLFSFFQVKGNEFPSVFRTITTDDGLSSNRIEAIYKDNAGFIWLGTQSGVSRFDGTDVKRYDKTGNDPVFCIRETDSITLWIGTEFGLKKFDRKTGQASLIKLDDKPLFVKKIETADENTLLVATDYGLFQVENDKPYKVIFENGISASNNLTSVIKGHAKGVYWLTSLNGLCKYDIRTKRTDVYRSDFELPDYNKLTCLTLVDSVIYSGTFNKGLVAYDIKTATFRKIPGFENDYILNITHSDGRLYIGTNGNGLKILTLRTAAIDIIAHDPAIPRSISSNAVYSFLPDGNTFWIGTYANGLNYNPRVNDNFGFYSSDKFNSLNYNVRSFYIFDNGDKLIGTRTGLFFISEKNKIVKKYTQRTENSELTSDIILYISPYGSKCLIGTYGGGMYIFDPVTTTLSRFRKEEVFMSGCIFRFFTDKDENLWIATNDGVYVYNTKTTDLKKYDTSNSGLSNNNILFLSQDSKGRIWIGTLDGLCILDKNTDVIRSDVFSKSYASMLKEIYYVYEDRTGNNWICTFQGVLKVDESLSGQIHYTANDFLPGDIVKSVIEDDNGNLWFATYGGIVCYNPVTNESTAYSAVDGILGYDFGNVVQGKSGSMFWWANERGLLYCDISELKPTASLSHPRITAFYISKKEVDDNDERFVAAEYLKKISLSYSENNIGFRFSLLNYSLPKSEVYEYMLEGYDTTWQKQVGKNDVYYSKLPSGKYVFRLRSPGDETSETSVEIEIGKDYSTFVWIAIIILLIGLFSMILYKKRKVFMKGFKKSLKQEKYKYSKIEQSNVEKITDKLTGYMESEKPYLDPDLKQINLAQAIGCSSTELSQIMNQYLKAGFTDFVNKYRIEEFKQRVQDKASAKYTLTALSEQCGFSSRSSFFRAFKKQTGQTPLEYLKSVNKDVEL